MRKPITRIGIAFAAFIAALFLTAGLPGCQQLFTTSLASALARDSIPLPDTLTTDQAAELAEEAKTNNDTKLATAIVETLVDQVTDPSTQTELAAAAASSAVVASGASQAVIEALSEAMESGDLDSLDAAALLETIQSGATADVLEALSYLDPSTGIGDPDSLESTELGATDYLIAAVVIAASALPEGSDPTDLSSEELTAFQATDEYDVAVSILAEAMDLVEEGSQGEELLDMFSGLFSI